MSVMQASSQLGQDLFVLDQLDQKKRGTFVDIGAGHPKEINNTFFLEKNYGWRGISVDIGPPHAHAVQGKTLDEYRDIWNSHRFTPLICGDALKINFTEAFKENNLPTTIDYLSLDLEPPLVTLECLRKIPFSEYVFNVITYETDAYREEGTEEESRALLTNFGYKLIRCKGRRIGTPRAGDVPHLLEGKKLMMTATGVMKVGVTKPQEDWYIHERLYNRYLLQQPRVIL